MADSITREQLGQYKTVIFLGVDVKNTLPPVGFLWAFDIWRFRCHALTMVFKYGSIREGLTSYFLNIEEGVGPYSTTVRELCMYLSRVFSCSPSHYCLDCNLWHFTDLNQRVILTGLCSSHHPISVPPHSPHGWGPSHMSCFCMLLFPRSCPGF